MADAWRRTERAGKLAAKYTNGMSQDEMTRRAVRDVMRWYRKLVREGCSAHDAWYAAQQVHGEMLVAWYREQKTRGVWL